MSLKTRFNALPLFWRVYLIIVSLLVFVVAFAELVLENLTEILLPDIYEKYESWFEPVLWAFGILVPALACGYILSKTLSSKLEKMAKVSQAIARGNMKIRLDTINNDQDAFDLLARSFNEMADAIEKQLENERRLLVDISHELRSPLTRITIATELLLRNGETGKDRQIIVRLEKELQHMNELIGLLLAQSRDSSGLRIESRKVDLGKILAELVADFSFQGQPMNKKVVTQLPASLTVSGNDNLLQRLFGNILSNAIFYTPPNSDVLLSVERDEEKLEITVRDFGPGVPEESLEDIFRAFYRVDSSRARKDGGTGLGLALAREAALAHEGDIMARNANPGLEVIVTLPISMLEAG
ncbi:ATP-binding protein [Oxalobacter vibrioformis]|uniref:histidine kinase n=1 Tax=Oxalobacter vibrioformis TaxID=933080 RepID=A0A9E9P2N5_9BURK|nr:ATP-binding protein [Oxalobacter vibrioformis]WAW10092.1 ATP-binding protein [Oxalobacter vibrioformis]